jgi:hypothetical protein
MQPARTSLGGLATNLPPLDGPPPTMAQLNRNLRNAGKPLDTCEHDWRIDDTLILDSEPPQNYVLCASCGACSSRVIPSARWEHHIEQWSRKD